MCYAIPCFVVAVLKQQGSSDRAIKADSRHRTGLEMTHVGVASKPKDVLRAVEAKALWAAKSGLCGTKQNAIFCAPS